MSWTLLKDAAPVSASGEKFKMIRMRKPGIYSAADEAHNGQPKENVRKDIRLKNGFFRPLFLGAFKSGGIGGQLRLI
jgi:hypothetical protein